MAVTTYKYKAFNSTEASSGTLCLLINDDYKSPEKQDGAADLTWQTISTNKLEKKEGSWVLTPVTNTLLKAAGVCKMSGANFIIAAGTENFTFNDKGRPVSENADKYYLYIGKTIITPQAVGNAIDVSYKSSTTRSATGIITTYDFGTGSTVMVDQLNARDAFAMQALQGIMEHIDRPDAVTDSEMDFYSTQAYKWAANMMMAAAQARSELKDGEGGETPEVQDTESVTVGALEGNTEKLLNNIVAALEKTDEKEALTTGEGENAETTTIFSERVSIPKLIKFLDNYVTHTEEPEEGSEDEPVTTKYGLYDLIQAIKDIDAGGGGGTTEVDFTPLITALQGLSTDRAVTALPNVNIGNTGLGRDADHPIYMTGGGFPTRAALAAALPAENIHDLLTFNAAGAVGYSTKEETKKALLGFLNDYADINTLSAAVLATLTGADIYNKIQSNIDTRIQQWLQAARDAENRPLTVNTPT